jgi:glyoxylase-like metal-dependent hydrolase (beta-lactamase superfamily II)
MLTDCVAPLDLQSSSYLAPDISIIRMLFGNVYLIGTIEQWVLVDTGAPFSAAAIRRAARELFGQESRPEGIILTHGHFDHAGSALELAEYWDIPIYAHPLEAPYLTGRSDYPPPDPTVGGALALLSRVFPHRGRDLGNRMYTVPLDGSVPGLPDWRWIHTPGHTHGHLSLFREADQVLIAGDALATTNQESVLQLLIQEQRLRWPPAPFTTNWITARQSIERLADLWPGVIAAGHGRPMEGPEVAGQLRSFAAKFKTPAKGRYVSRPAIADETGVVALPPRPPDALPKWIMVGVVIAAAYVAYSRWRRA